MTTAKKPTATKADLWPQSAIDSIKSQYTGPECNDSSILEKFVAGKTAAQVRGKLVSLGIYVKGEPKAAESSAASTAARKGSLVKAIEIFAGLPAGSLESLEKASKPELQLLSLRLTELSDQYNASIPSEVDDEPATSGM
jgi:hypothetical protein